MKAMLLTLALIATWALPAAAQVSGDALKIGIVGDESGSNASQTGPGLVAAARMAVEDFGGKVLGKPIQILVADYQGKPDIGAAIVRKWIDDEHVQVIADGATSALAAAIQVLTHDRNRIYLNFSGSSSDLTGKACTEQASQWLPDTYSVGAGAVKAIVPQGGKSWYFITVDYSFGQALERDASAAVKALGGTVVGSVRHPLASQDFSSYVLQAQASKAQIIGLANSGDDTINTIKQAQEFGLTANGQKLAALQFFITNVHGLGLQRAQNLEFMTNFYWDTDDATRAWTKRWIKNYRDQPPSRIQVGAYSGVLHYLKAVQAAGTDEAKAVAAEMKKMPINDFWLKNAKLRVDGRVMTDMYLVQVKTPAESKYPMDYLKVLRKIPADEAFRPLSEGGCALAAAAK